MAQNALSTRVFQKAHYIIISQNDLQRTEPSKMPWICTECFSAVFSPFWHDAISFLLFSNISWKEPQIWNHPHFRLIRTKIFNIQHKRATRPFKFNWRASFAQEQVCEWIAKELPMKRLILHSWLKIHTAAKTYRSRSNTSCTSDSDY